MSDPWDSIAGVLPTRFPNPEVAANVLEAAMLCGAITHPQEASELRRLVITGVKLATLEGIERFPALDELELRGTLTSNLDGIERAPALQHLTAWGVNVRSLAPLSALRGLRTLRLQCGHTSKVSALDGIERCTQLRHLEVNGSTIRSLEPLAKLRRLRVLDVSDSKLASLAGIEKLPLTRLDLSSTQVADLAPLAKVRSLRWLDLSNTRIKDVGPLAKLDQLRVLSMTNTKVRDLAPLAALSRLVDLAIGGNPVANAQPLTKLTALRDLLAWGTKLADDVVQPLEAAARARGAAQPPPGLLALALDLGLASDEADAAEITHFDVKDRHDVANLEDLDRMPALLVLRLDHGALLRGNGGAGSRLRSLRISPRERLSLGHLAHLQELVIVEAQPLDLPPALRALRLCSVECDEPIDLPPGLRSFQAEACRLTRLPDVQRCPHLVHLAITKSYIRDASPIAQHPALRTLELPHNRIEDVVPIAHASELRRIDLDANPVASIEPLARLAKLRWLSVRMTPVAQRSSRFDGVEIEA